MPSRLPSGEAAVNGYARSGSTVSSGSSSNSSRKGSGNMSCAKDVKDVVIVGNGPSAISLSFMLSGNAPYYLGGASDEHLHTRLKSNPNETILLQDLEELATGCEGRSNNPVSVFFDLLNHPDADTGQEKPSLLEWRKRTDLQLDHVVLGKGRPGGCWDSLDGGVQTVSLGNWMELPNLKLGEVGCRANCRSTNRVNVAHVASYYREYVQRLGLADNFVDRAVVTSVKEVKDLDCSGGRTSNRSSVKRSVQSAPSLGNERLRHSSEASSTMSTIYSEESGPPFDIFDVQEGEQEDSGSVCCCSSPDDDDDEEEDDDSICQSPPTLNPAGSRPIPVSDEGGGGVSAVASRRRKNSLGHSALGVQLQMRHYQRHYSGYSQIHLFDESSARDGQMEELAGAAACHSAACWDAIVNPELFCSVGSGSCGGAGGASVRSRTSSWSVCEKEISAVARSNSRCLVSECFPGSERIFEVRGHTTDEKGEQKDFRYLSKNVVLATGSYDRPNRVRLEGEDHDFIVHSLAELESRLEEKSEEERRKMDPVVVVGAGLSAADAVIMLRGAGVRTRHAFRRNVDDPSMIFKVLPKALYPEYQEVYRLMRGDKIDSGPSAYLPLPEHELVEIIPGRVAVFEERSSGARVSLRLSHLAILIGSSPDLDFLEPKLRRRLGVVKAPEEVEEAEGEDAPTTTPLIPIGRSNPVDIELFTNEAVDVPGVYAMGPLVGDNFVRFLLGGALAIATDVIRKEKKATATMTASP